MNCYAVVLICMIAVLYPNAVDAHSYIALPRNETGTVIPQTSLYSHVANELIVCLTPGALNWPEPLASSGPEAVEAESALNALFTSTGVTSMRKVFPDLSVEDHTIQVDSTSIAVANLASTSSYFYRSGILPAMAPPRPLSELFQPMWARSQQAGGGGIDTLIANDTTPLVLNVLCGGTYSGVAGRDNLSVADWLVLTPRRGASAVAGPTRAVHEIVAYEFSRRSMLELFGLGGPEYVRAGGAYLRAKWATLGALPSTYATEIASMVYLGDPALNVYVGNPVVHVDTREQDKVREPLQMTVVGSEVGSLTFRMIGLDEGPIEIGLFDVRGRMRWRGERQALTAENVDWRADVGRLTRGVYFALLRNAGRAATTKVVVLK